MSEADEALRRALGEWLDEARQGEAEHPAPEELLAYQADRASAEAEERVRQHLALCQDCLELLRDAARFAPRAPASPAEEARVEAAWAALRPALATDRPPAPVVSLAERRQPPARPPRWLTSLAAGLALATLGLSGWVVSLSHRVEELSAPQPNAPVFDLLPGGAERATGGEGEALTLAPGDRWVTLVLALATTPEPGAHRLEIRRADGSLATRIGGLSPNTDGTFTLTLARRTLGEGRFTVRLLRGEEATPVAEYRLVIEGRQAGGS